MKGATNPVSYQIRKIKFELRKQSKLLRNECSRTLTLFSLQLFYETLSIYNFTCWKYQWRITNIEHFYYRKKSVFVFKTIRHIFQSYDTSILMLEKYILMNRVETMVNDYYILHSTEDMKPSSSFYNVY